MTNKLTDFEAYISYRAETDPEFDTDTSDNGIFLFGVMDSMQENFKAEYDELTDNCCNALDASERLNAILNRTTQPHLREDEKVIAEQIKAFIDEALKEAEYKILCQKEETPEIDGSYQAKQYRELHTRVEL